MKTKFNKLVVGAVLASSMIFSAEVAMARDYRQDYRSYNQNYNSRNGYDYRELETARNKLMYDWQHHASRKKLAQDQAVIDQMLDGNRGYAQSNNGWWRW